MKSISTLVAALGLALTATQPARADAPTANPAPVSAPATKFTLDTPIETLVADTRTKAVLEADLPGLTSHPQFDQFKSMSLTMLAPFAPDRLTPDRLDKVKADLAKLN
jgi:hypothetical protein